LGDLGSVRDTLKRRFQTLARPNSSTGDISIAARVLKPSTRIRARLDRTDQAEAFAAPFGDNPNMIQVVTAECGSTHIKKA
jgi:hypothetical protein